MVVCIKKVSCFNKSSKKEVDKFTSRDLLLYFSAKYGEYTGIEFKIPRDGWVGMMYRIKTFQDKLKLTYPQYMEFIDNIFELFFTQENYVPNFGSIVSEKVFFIVKKLVKSKQSSCSNMEFEQLKQQLYSSDLFKKLRQ
jgi:hypothetical protein